MMNLLSIHKIFIPLIVLGLFAFGENKSVDQTTMNNVMVVAGWDGMEKNILYYINEHRTALGLPALVMLPEASRQAAEHSEEMAEKKTDFGHEGFEERVRDISEKTGAVSAAAENVAYGQLDARSVVDGWLHSPGHKKNIEGNYTFTGIGIAKDRNGVIFFTQIFIRKQNN
jgi:uncharacterized protein YkwD